MSFSFAGRKYLGDMKVIKFIVCLFTGILLSMYLLMNLSVWIKLQPPASVLLTMPKIMIPNVMHLLVVFDVIVIVLLGGYGIYKRQVPTWMIIVGVVLAISLVSGIIFIARVGSVSLGLDLVNYEIDYQQADYALLDLDADAKIYHQYLDMVQLYIPEQITKKTCFVYFPYGNYLIHDDMSMHERLRDLMLNEGYAVAYITGRSRLNGDIVDIVKDLKCGLAFLDATLLEYGYEDMVVSGGSAGGHLAQLVAYTYDDPVFSKGLENEVSVDGVISFYGTSDLRMDYAYFKQDGNLSIWDILGNKMYALSSKYGEKTLEEANQIMTHGVLNGLPEVSDLYALSDTKLYVSEDSPNTLLIHGNHDSMTPYAACDDLYLEMVERGSHVAMLELPNVDHAFDSIVLDGSVPARKAFEETMKWMLYYYE